MPSRAHADAPSSRDGDDLDAQLQVLRDGATALSQERIAREVAELAARLAGGRFYVACLGQFKRGKSSLLNALLGRAILPVGVLPVTSVVTVVRHGAEDVTRIHFGDGSARDVALGDLADFVSEENNPGNTRNVIAAEVFVACPLLSSGLCLVDTPGLGSVFAHNTDATRAFLPQVDAVVLCIGADPPPSVAGR
jgi:ribosome biogenesis GTPase A